MSDETAVFSFSAAFSRRLTSLRIERGLTRAAVAVGAGVAPSSIGYYEKGEKIPNAEILARLCAFYHVPADYLLSLTDQAVRREWPPAVPVGAVTSINKLKVTAEEMISDAFHAPYGCSALSYYVDAFKELRAIDATVAKETHKMAQRYPGFKSFGRFDAVKIDGVGLREALVQNNERAREYVVAYDEGLANIQDQISEVSARIFSILQNKVTGAVTCGAVISFPAPVGEDLLDWPRSLYVVSISMI